MNKKTGHSERTRELLIKHYQTYPKLQTEDVFKYIFQSAFGCEHLVSSEDAVLNNIKLEYATVSKQAQPKTEILDGEYSRVFLSHLNDGLKPETLAKLVCLSAKKEPNGAVSLEEKIEVAKLLVADGTLPFDVNCFDEKLACWRAMGYPAVRHSEEFRAEYRPAYRVVANRYAEFIQVFAGIDKLLDQGDAVVAIEGGSASGKTTLAGILCEVYDCNIFHMDDFFLRPEQRTPQRFAEVGGNIDRERFFSEVIKPISENREVVYRRFDCTSQTLCEPITVKPKKLTVIEGAYSMHPQFAQYYDFSVFMDIDAEYQRERILKRNRLPLANRFFNEWIPLEIEYFSKMKIKEKCSITVSVAKIR